VFLLPSPDTLPLVERSVSLPPEELVPLEEAEISRDSMINKQLTSDSSRKILLDILGGNDKWYFVL